MKRLFLFILAAGMVLSIAGCITIVDYDTPKSEELSAQYDFYEESQRVLASGMAITPEQADEVFLTLLSCGMDGKVSKVERKFGDEGHCKISAVGSLMRFDVYYTDGIVDCVKKGGKQLYPLAPEPEEEPEPEKVYEYDALQTIFMSLTDDTSVEELWSMISENDLSFTVEEYNGGEVAFCIAFTEGAALQKYAEHGDHLNITFKKNGDNYMSNENSLMHAQYVNNARFSALYYTADGTLYDFRADMEGDYSGYYILDVLSKEDGIVIKYNNGRETTTKYFKYNSAEEVIQKMIDGINEN